MVFVSFQYLSNIGEQQKCHLSYFLFYLSLAKTVFYLAWAD